MKDATKRGKAHLRKSLPLADYDNTCALEYTLRDGTWEPQVHASVSLPLKDVLKAYLVRRSGSVLVAWNLRGHDKHVLTRAVGEQVMGQLVLWDALPWFRSKYSLPKNTMSSKKPGTPRAVFGVPDYGSAHSSLADAAHMRDVVLRAAYCADTDGKIDLGAHLTVDRVEQLKSVHAEVELCTTDAEWNCVAGGAWTAGMIPKEIYQVPHT